MFFRIIKDYLIVYYLINLINYIDNSIECNLYKNRIEFVLDNKLN